MKIGLLQPILEFKGSSRYLQKGHHALVADVDLIC